MSNISTRMVAFSIFGVSILHNPFVIAAASAQVMQTINMSCQSVQNQLLEQGNTVLSYPSQNNPSLTLHDNYVGSAGQCPFNETWQFALVRTSDRENCPVISCIKHDAIPKPIEKEIDPQRPPEEPDGEANVDEF